MKKLLLLLCAWFLVLGIQAQERSGHFFMTFKDKNMPMENVEQRFSEWFALPDGTEWRLVGSSTDQLGMERIEYRQYLSGIEVENSQILLHAKNGVLLSANGTVMEASKTPKKQLRSAIIYKEGTPTDMMGQELYLIYTPGGYRYATKVLSFNSLEWKYTDVETGQVLKTIPTRNFESEIKTPAQASGHSIFSGDVTIDVTQRGDGSTYLHDQKRNIHTLVGAYLPSLDELASIGKLYDYFPQGNLPDNYEEATKEQMEEWSKYLEEVIAQNKLDKFEKYLLDFTDHVKNPGSDYSLNKINSLTINKLTTTNDEGEDVEASPTDEAPYVLSMLVTFGANGSKGLITTDLFYINKFPYTIDLSQYIKVIPKEGINLVFSESKMDMTTFETVFNPLDTVRFTAKTDDNKTFTHKSDKMDFVMTYGESPDPTVDIHWGMAKTLDYYKEILNRNSYDDQGSPVYNLVYLSNNEDDEIISTPPNNASALASLAPYPMVYGLGDFKVEQVSLPVVELSVMAHEFTHIVTGHTAKLEYSGESGALNESFSDLIGISVKKYVKGENCGWDIGGDGLLMNKKNLRDMAVPENSCDDPCPGTYKGQYWVDTEDLEEDHGGVHTNSGVQNKWYYLLTDGDSGVNDNGDSYNVTGIGIKKSEQIAYRTLTVYATIESQYSDIRRASLQAAEDLYGTGGNEVQAVAKAWDAVGVYDRSGHAPSGIEQMTVEDTAADDAIYNLQGVRVDKTVPGIYIKNGKKMVIR